VPSIEDNRKTWTDHPWAARGEGWSRMWGRSTYEWWGTLYPRLREFLPTGTLLEIATGYGRWTRYLVHLCDRLIGVDLVEKCVEHCRGRFAEYPHATFHQNDGVSLEMVADGSVDFAFSFDSLVHVDRDVVDGYLSQLAGKLTPDAVGFIHHSNLGAYVDPATGKPPFRNPNWRDLTMSAPLFQELCAGAGLLCIGQELVNWEIEQLNDCFSLVTLPGSRFERPNVLVENPRFMDEASALQAVAQHYGADGFPGVERVPPPAVEPAAGSQPSAPAAIARRRPLSP
jgi:SAM-dependent methyltransferase